MLSRIRAKHFKSFVSLDVELGRLNLFIGANGSGKSNLLEALGVLSAAAFGRVDDETLLRRGVRPGVPRLYKTAFPLPPDQQSPHIQFGATTVSGASYDVTLWNPLDNPSPAWRFKTENLRLSTSEVVVTRTTTSAGKHNQEQGLAALHTVNLLPADEALTLLNQLRNYSIYCPNTPTLRGLVQDLQAREPVGLAGGRLPEAISELRDVAKKSTEMASLLDEVLAMIDWARAFSAEPSTKVPLSPSAARSRLVIQFIDRHMTKTKSRNRLTGYDASEGALYILFCAVLALHPRAPECLALDNVDQALNPRLATLLMRAMAAWTKKTRPRQWVMTAHNPAILDGLPLQDPDVRLFAVERSSKGHTTIARIDIEGAMRKRPNAEWTLSRMWMNGLLGAVPNV